MDAQETKIFYLAVAIVLVFALISYLFIASLKRQHQRILQLKLQNITAELNSIEKDRARIAADLHDQLSPLLSAVKFRVSSFELPAPEDRVQQQMTDEHLGEVIQQLRTIAYNLMPATLKRKGLRAALEEFTGYVSQQNGLQVELQAEDIPLSEEQSIHLYRIAQEIVHNTVKHAGATLLELSLRPENGKIVLSSKDNGRGFDYEGKLAEGGGFGLRNLLSRTDVLGGALFIESHPGKGTAYTVELPVKEKTVN